MAYNISQEVIVKKMSNNTFIDNLINLITLDIYLKLAPGHTLDKRFTVNNRIRGMLGQTWYSMFLIHYPNK